MALLGEKSHYWERKSHCWEKNVFCSQWPNSSSSLLLLIFFTVRNRDLLPAAPSTIILILTLSLRLCTNLRSMVLIILRQHDLQLILVDEAVLQLLPVPVPGQVVAKSSETPHYTPHSLHFLNTKCSDLRKVPSVSWNGHYRCSLNVWYFLHTTLKSWIIPNLWFLCFQFIKQFLLCGFITNALVYLCIILFTLEIFKGSKRLSKSDNQVAALSKDSTVIKAVVWFYKVVECE